MNRPHDGWTPGRAPRWVMVNCAGETLTEAQSGGIAAWVLGVCRAARADGVDMPVLTKRHPTLPAAWDAAVELDYPWPSFPGHSVIDRQFRGRLQYVHPWQPLWNRRVVDRLREIAPEPCAVLLHNDPELAVVVAKALPQHRVWHLLHNTNPLGRRWHALFRQQVHPLAVSRFVADWLEAHVGLARGSVGVVPGGVDTTVFAPGEKADPPMVSYAGLFNERKGPDLLLTACERVAQAHPGLPFAVRLFGAAHYGPDEVDDYGRLLRASVERLRHAGIRVDLPGFLTRERLAAALSRSAVHVVPSRWDEPFGLTALEGMASGAAVVVAERGGLPEVVADAGARVAPDDPAALADVLAQLLTDGERRARCGDQARARAERMTWSHTWRALERLQTPGPNAAGA